VLNEADTVRIEAQGGRAILTLSRYLAKLRAASGTNRYGRVAEIAVVDYSASGVPAIFQIRTSESQSIPRPTIPTDLATCCECLAEINIPISVAIDIHLRIAQTVDALVNHSATALRSASHIDG